MLPVTDLYDICNPIPTPDKPTTLTITFRRDRADRFYVSASTLRLFPGDLIGGSGFAATAVQNLDYFEAFAGWWYEQDPDRPFADRFREFLRLYESGHFAR